MNITNNHKTGLSPFDRFQSIILESRQFREECERSVTKSKALLEVSSSLANDTQEQLELSMILKEEMLSNKCEALSILKLGIEVETLNKSQPVSVNYWEELKIVEETLAELDLISITPENKILQKLRHKFLNLSYLP